MRFDSTHALYYWLLFQEIKKPFCAVAFFRNSFFYLIKMFSKAEISFESAQSCMFLETDWNQCTVTTQSWVRSHKLPRGARLTQRQITKNRNNHYFKSFFFIAAYLLPVMLSLWNIKTSGLRDIVVTSQVIWHATTTSDKHGYHRPLLWITW